VLAADVGERFEAAVAHWRLRDPRPLEGGCIALVCEAEGAVLKLNPQGHRDDAQLAGEGDALAFWEPSGAVARLLGSRDDGFSLLMERLDPGTPLNETGAGWEEQLEVLGGLAARLHAQGDPGDGFISMSDFYADWRGAEVERLVASAHDDVLVHADLHAGNALLHAPNGGSSTRRACAATGTRTSGRCSSRRRRRCRQTRTPPPRPRGGG
jgi:streptomycin 6-kinase